MKRLVPIVLLSLLAAACGGLEHATGIPDPFGTPQPFQGQGDPALVGEVLGERSVFIGPIAGLDAEADISLRRAIAANAAALDVLASAETAPRGALTLSGVAAGSTVRFSLADGAAELSAFEASGEPAILAVGAARALAQSLGRLGPAQPARSTIAAEKTPAAYIREIAARDAAKAAPLKRGVSAKLAEMGVRMQDGPAPEAYAVTAALGLSDQNGLTAISIVWKVYAPGGEELGQAAQDNTIPTAEIRANWPEIATMASGAAAESVARIIASHFRAP